MLYKHLALVSSNFKKGLANFKDFFEIGRVKQIKVQQAQKDATLAAERMEALAATIAHEMRTPLYSIGGLMYTANKYILSLLDTYEIAEKNGLSIEKIGAKDQDLLRCLAEAIQLETRKAFISINLLLANISQQQLKKHEFSDCHLAELIEHAVEKYPLDDEQRACIHINTQPEFLFHGDPELFTYVIFNLLKNSLYYTANKGEIYIFTVLKDAHNELHFKDTGKGIAAEVLPYIFEPFFSKTYHGTGLGLPFCKSVMESMGGSISCDSRESQYTEFVLSFPKS